MKIAVQRKPVTRNTIYLFDKQPIKEVYIWYKHNEPTLLYQLKVKTGKEIRELAMLKEVFSSAGRIYLRHTSKNAHLIVKVV